MRTNEYTEREGELYIYSYMFEKRKRKRKKPFQRKKKKDERFSHMHHTSQELRASLLTGWLAN